MKTLHKELICLATSYLDMYITDKENTVHPDVVELFEFLRREVFYTICNKDMNKALDHMTAICSKMQLASLGKEQEVYELGIIVQCCFALIEDNVFTLSKGMKLKRLAMSINNDLEVTIGFDEAIKNGRDIICKIVDKEK